MCPGIAGLGVTQQGDGAGICDVDMVYCYAACLRDLVCTEDFIHSLHLMFLKLYGSLRASIDVLHDRVGKSGPYATYLVPRQLQFNLCFYAGATAVTRQRANSLLCVIYYLVTVVMPLL